MFEKVNPEHPDKVADRIAGALVDIAYTKQENPKVAVEVLIGHNECTIIVESSVEFTLDLVSPIVKRITKLNDIKINLLSVKQDEHLAQNQNGAIRCGDNGIFKGMPMTNEQKTLTSIAKDIFTTHPTDGKYVINEVDSTLVVCQSCADSKPLVDFYSRQFRTVEVNPLGEWTGGVNVDTGATNRKLGSDMGDSITGGGLHGKDLSKADVSINIYAFLKAQESNVPVELYCAIGDEIIDGRPYDEIVDIAKSYIKSIGGFEKFAEWGLIR